jgi:hypothetical protein
MIIETIIIKQLGADDGTVARLVRAARPGGSSGRLVRAARPGGSSGRLVRAPAGSRFMATAREAG